MSSESKFTHLTPDGRPVMVDVSAKPTTNRVAIAQSLVRMQSSTRDAIVHQAIRKGDVLSIAQLAGIMAAKKTSDLIPLCHHVPLHHVSLELNFVDEVEQRDEAVLSIQAKVETAYQTGVEMEALTACSVAALTVYDMCKALDRGMVIEQVRLMYKAGGKSGVFQAIPTS
ncbi:cyclic pyranopterin monophosphate synthase MoaC [Alicyclobacillus fastidiosus]|uniref:Cyclic pyranopterin monophosphate synthase n=1 Tax=Alicyclobacillus fastidiosus TaxID=392011 RepID=A0ABV5AG30_9BACL|nr:cyclic pyranopterin monophosphate synthase MoaC [Alicyclobacillus fastidiosus]WEH11746.1 cyclic pyranopterin monophosphate synthase MoaC [Alicyclobacillus fastidiosus]